MNTSSKNNAIVDILKICSSNVINLGKKGIHSLDLVSYEPHMPNLQKIN
jgi:hypothetical protein